MGEAKIDQKALESAMLKALPTLFPHLCGTTNNPRAEFYSKFKREAEEHDEDFLKKYGGDLDTTLIFAALFSAVASAFIVDVRTQLTPDYGSLSYAVADTMARVNLGIITPNDAELPTVPGPDPTLARVQAILFSSLALSLLASFVAMLGKQWLARYTQVDMHGSLVARGQDRQRKIDGITSWRFDWFMESLPIMLQLALLLLGCAIAIYFHTIAGIDSWVIGGFTAVGVVFFLGFVIAGVASYNCPFQTPLSLGIRFLMRFYKKRRDRRRAKEKEALPGAHGAPNANGAPGAVVLTMIDPLMPLGKEKDRECFVADSNCIDWMFKRSMDEDVILDIAAFIPELTWHDGIRISPLRKLYDGLMECFDKSSGRPVVHSKFMKKAYLSAKAFLHVAIHRKYFENEPDEAVLNSISARHQVIGDQHYDGNSDLESTLGMIDRVLQNEDLGAMRWNNFAFTDSHRAWMGHTLLCRTSYILQKGGKVLPDDIKGFVRHSLAQNPLPPSQAVLDCLFIVSRVLDIPLQTGDKQVTDKSPEIQLQIEKIYRELVQTFQNAAGDIKRATEAMELIAPLSNSTSTAKSYDLFRVIMKGPDSLTDPEKLKAARLALHGAYKSNKFMPPAGNPRDVLAFLNHHFKLVAEGEIQKEPIEDALRALVYTSNQGAIESVKDFDPPKTPFIRGMRSAFQDSQFPQLRRAALFFLPIIGDRLFTTDASPDDMKGLCADWASTVEENCPAGDVNVRKAALAVLFRLMVSTHWRPHIPDKSWKLLEYFASVPDDFQPLKKCLDSKELISAIKSNPERLRLWSTILWLRYMELKEDIQTELKALTRGKPTEAFAKAIDLKLSATEQESTQYTTWSKEADVLREKGNNLKKAKETLGTLKRGY